MSKNNINDLFNALTPGAKQKEKIYNKIVSSNHDGAKSRPRYRIRLLHPAFISAVLCTALILGLINFFSATPSFSVYAYGPDVEITREAVEISTGTISDSGEMRGHLLQLYVAGEKIENIRFSCVNQYLEFNDWTERQPFVGRVKIVDVSYDGVTASDYYYLRIDWIPWDTQRILTENREIGIADLDSGLREDVITLEVTFENGSAATRHINVKLDDTGEFTANLIDD
jgi:hypothetical protein